MSCSWLHRGTACRVALYLHSDASVTTPCGKNSVRKAIKRGDKRAGHETREKQGEEEGRGDACRVLTIGRARRASLCPARCVLGPSGGGASVNGCWSGSPLPPASCLRRHAPPHALAGSTWERRGARAPRRTADDEPSPRPCGRFLQFEKPPTSRLRWLACCRSSDDTWPCRRAGGLLRAFGCSVSSSLHSSVSFRPGPACRHPHGRASSSASSRGLCVASANFQFLAKRLIFEP